MNWRNLSQIKGTSFYSGTIFRFSAKPPYENFVDYMLVLDGGLSKSYLKFVVTTGNKAGRFNILCEFPDDAYQSGSISILSDWLQQNWSEWVYDDCEMKDVYVSDGYPPPTELPNVN